MSNKPNPRWRVGLRDPPKVTYSSSGASAGTTHQPPYRYGFREYIVQAPDELGALVEARRAEREYAREETRLRPRPRGTLDAE